MINKVGIVSILMGVLGIFMYIDTNYLAPVKTNPYHMSRGIVYGSLAIIFGVYCMLRDSKTGLKEAKIFNYTETDSDINCTNCKCCDMSSFDGYEANCKFFKMKINRDHVCDLGIPESKVKPKKIEPIDPGKRVI